MMGTALQPENLPKHERVIKTSPLPWGESSG